MISKPCPFCGCKRNHLEIDFVGPSKDEIDFCWMECDYCGAHGPVADDATGALNAWCGNGAKADEPGRPGAPSRNERS